MRCSHCKKKIQDDSGFVRIKLSNVHNQCLDAFIEKHRQKGESAKIKREERLESVSKEIKYKKSISATQKIFNRSVRAFWADEQGYCKCVTCGRRGYWEGDGIDAGHYQTVGARDDLRFDRRQVHPQCSNCNVYRDVSNEYERFMVKHLGDEEHSLLLQGRSKQKHDLVAIRRESREILRGKGFTV